MTRRTFSGFPVFLLSVTLLAGCAPETDHSAAIPTEDEILARAQAIHQAAITIDTHDDILGNWGTPEIDPCTGTDMKVDIPKMVAGGLDMAFPAVYVGQGPRTPGGKRRGQESGTEQVLGHPPGGRGNVPRQGGNRLPGR